MAYPDFSKPYILHTDASEEGLSAVLYQEQVVLFVLSPMALEPLAPLRRQTRVPGTEMGYL